MTSPLLPITIAIAAWLVIGVLGLIRPRDLRIVRVLFSIGVVVAVVLAMAAFNALSRPPEASVLPLGLPELPFHLRVDALSAIFLILLGSATAAISMFSSG